MPPFDTRLDYVRDDDGREMVAGPWRAPVNILQHQTYGGHASIHDDATAQQLGFAGAPIEGPTHFSQIAPLAVARFGQAWLSRGCVSVHFRAPVFEGEQVQVLIDPPHDDERRAAVRMVKADGTEVLRGSLTLGNPHPPTALEQRLAGLAPLTDARILAAMAPGPRPGRLTVRMTANDPFGDLYPFSLTDKLAVITEDSAWYHSGLDTPWDRPIMPFEMISVLCQYRIAEDPLPIPGEAIGLFADQEIRLTDGPLFLFEDYEIEREIVALTGSRRTESLWTRTRIYRSRTGELAGEMLLNQAYLRDSVTA